MNVVATIRDLAGSTPTVTVAAFKAAHPRARCVPQAFQHLARRGELVARVERGRGHAGRRKVYSKAVAHAG